MPKWCVLVVLFLALLTTVPATAQLERFPEDEGWINVHDGDQVLNATTTPWLNCDFQKTFTGSITLQGTTYVVGYYPLMTFWLPYGNSVLFNHVTTGTLCQVSGAGLAAPVNPPPLPYRTYLPLSLAR